MSSSQTKSYGISGQIFGLISSFTSNRRLRVVLDRKPSQEFNELPDDVNCDIAIYADDTTLYSKCDQASDLWQQLELASELESDLQDTVDWVRSGLLISMLGKLSWFRLTGLITMVLLM